MSAKMMAAWERKPVNRLERNLGGESGVLHISNRHAWRAASDTRPYNAQLGA